MLAHLGISGPDVLIISSLAKAFGVPVAILSGSNKAVEEFELKSQTRMHCSPPSQPVIRAAQHALAVNRAQGDRLRQRLASLVTRFRHRSTQAGFRLSGDLFPVQSISLAREEDVVKLHERLLTHGVRTILHRVGDEGGLRLSFLLSARHSFADIDHAASALAKSRAVSGVSNKKQSGGI